MIADELKMSHTVFVLPVLAEWRMETQTTINIEMFWMTLNRFTLLSIDRNEFAINIAFICKFLNSNHFVTYNNNLIGWTVAHYL